MLPRPSWKKYSTTHSDSICSSEDCDYHSTKLRPGCDTVWKYYARTLFHAFQAANPDLWYRDHRGCALDLIPRHSCTRTKDHRISRGPGFDHDEQARLPDGTRFIISHPYPRPDEDAQDPYTQDILQSSSGLAELAVAHAGTGRSWYFPTHSTLIVIALAENIGRINLDYDVPTNYQPQGCIRWQEPRPTG